MIASRTAMLIPAIALMPVAPAALARETGDVAKIGACIRRAAQGRPWLEKTLWGLRDQEGGWIGAEIRNRDGSHDLGPLQVNSWWVARVSQIVGRPASQVRQWLIHDACFNVDVARWIFLSGLATTRDYWNAIGIYHSPTARRQFGYARRVAGKLTIRYGPDVFAVGGRDARVR